MSRRIPSNAANVNIDDECMEIFGCKEKELNEISRRIQHRQQESTKKIFPPVRPLDICEQMFLPEKELRFIESKRN